MGSAYAFIGEHNYLALQFIKELRGFMIRQKNTNPGIFQYTFIMLRLGARLCFCRRAFLYPISENAGVTAQDAAPHPLISILPVNKKIEIGGITHEKNQSAGLLPVLFKRYSC